MTARKENLNRILDQIDAELASHEANTQLALQNARLRTKLAERLSHQGSDMAMNDPAALVDSSAPRPSLLDDAIALEAEFAVTHPLAERLMREFINSLSKLGI